MRRSMQGLALALAILLLVAGCTGLGRPGGVALPTPAGSPTTLGGQPVPQASVLAPRPLDTAPAPNATGLPAPVRIARNFVANLAGVDPRQVQVETFERVDWPDACLGVINPDQACAQVVTPGYRIVFNTPKGPYELHTDLSGTNARLAGGVAGAGVPTALPAQAIGTPPSTAGAAPGGASPLATGIPLGGILPVPVQALTATLSQKLNLPAQQLTLVSAEAVEWPDACLGAVEKGEMCAQVVTPGYLLVFDSPNGQYEIHTDESGQNVRVVKK